MNFIIHTRTDGLEELVTVINGIPYYQSAGIDSNLANTWVPFFGLYPKQDGGYFYIKPSYKWNGCTDFDAWKHIQEAYPSEIIKMIKTGVGNGDITPSKSDLHSKKMNNWQLCRNVLTRFGGYSDMSYSRALDINCHTRNSFWSTQTGKSISPLLSHVSLPVSLPPMEQLGKVNSSELNKWLISEGAQISEKPRLNVDLAMRHCQINPSRVMSCHTRRY